MSARTQFPSSGQRLCALLATTWLASAAGCTGKAQSHNKDKATAQESQPDALQPLTRVADSHGFNDSIAWQPLDGALATAQQREQPVMLVVHASWCNRCKELKPKFTDAEIAKLSQQFVMVNADQDLERKSLEFAPDGDYIPRVIFIDPKTGKADETLLNQRRSRNRYFYTPVDDLAGVMKEALARYGRT